jgi:hypothetical protein
VDGVAQLEFSVNRKLAMTVVDFSVEHSYSYLGIPSGERRASVPIKLSHERVQSGLE